MNCSSLNDECVMVNKKAVFEVWTWNINLKVNIKTENRKKYKPTKQNKKPSCHESTLPPKEKECLSGTDAWLVSPCSRKKTQRSCVIYRTSAVLWPQKASWGSSAEEMKDSWKLFRFSLCTQSWSVIRRATCLFPSCPAAQTQNNHTEAVLFKSLLCLLVLASHWLALTS